MSQACVVRGRGCIVSGGVVATFSGLVGIPPGGVYDSHRAGRELLKYPEKIKRTRIIDFSIDK